MSDATEAPAIEGRPESGAEDFARAAQGNNAAQVWAGALDYLRDNPGKTILVSAALGLLLGRLLRRS